MNGILLMIKMSGQNVLFKMRGMSFVANQSAMGYNPRGSMELTLATFGSYSVNSVNKDVICTVSLLLSQTEGFVDLLVLVDEGDLIPCNWGNYGEGRIREICTYGL